MRTRTAIGLFFVSAAIIGTVAYKMYESRSVPRALPVLVPFAIDTEGKSITIPFDVRQGEVDIERGLMVALDVPNGPDLPAVEDVRVNSRSMRVKVFYDDHGVRIPVETEDVETVFARNTGKPQPHSDPSICLLHLYSILDDESHIAVCGFYAKRYGHYVAEVSTIESLPAFKGIVTTILVDEFYNTGK
jgi:hypothetical protein